MIETHVISASLRGIVFTWFLTCVSVCEANRVYSLSGYCVFTETPLLIRLASSRQSFYGNTQLCTARLRRCPRSGRSFESIFRACTHRPRCCLLRVNGTHRVLVPLNSVLCFQHRPTWWHNLSLESSIRLLRVKRNPRTRALSCLVPRVYASRVFVPRTVFHILIPSSLIIFRIIIYGNNVLCRFLVQILSYRYIVIGVQFLEQWIAYLIQIYFSREDDKEDKL